MPWKRSDVCNIRHQVAFLRPSAVPTLGIYPKTCPNKRSPKIRTPRKKPTPSPFSGGVFPRRPFPRIRIGFGNNPAQPAFHDDQQNSQWDSHCSQLRNRGRKWHICLDVRAPYGFDKGMHAFPWKFVLSPGHLGRLLFVGRYGLERRYASGGGKTSSCEFCRCLHLARCWIALGGCPRARTAGPTAWARRANLAAFSVWWLWVNFPTIRERQRALAFHPASV